MIRNVPYVGMFCMLIMNVASAQWSAPVFLSPNMTGIVHAPGFAINAMNDPHVMWQVDSNLAGNEIYYSFFNGVSWSAPENVSRTSTPSSQPVPIVDTDGDINLFWGERLGQPSIRPNQPPTDIFYSVKLPSGWTTAISLCHYDTDLGIPLWDAEVDDHGRVYLTWQTPTDDTIHGPIHLVFRLKDSTG